MNSKRGVQGVHTSHVKGVSVFIPKSAFRRGYIDHARTDVQALATFTVAYHRARFALRYREGSSRIGRRSREIIVPSVSNAGACGG